MEHYTMTLILGAVLLAVLGLSFLEEKEPARRVILRLDGKGFIDYDTGGRVDIDPETKEEVLIGYEDVSRSCQHGVNDA